MVIFSLFDVGHHCVQPNLLKADEILHAVLCVCKPGVVGWDEIPASCCIAAGFPLRCEPAYKPPRKDPQQ